MISLKDLFRTIYFNFKYLPPTVAIKLPIYLHNVKFDDMRGSIRIESNNIRRGMITIGSWWIKVFPNSPSVWQNHGGTVVFKGTCRMGAASALSINKNATLTFGDDFLNTHGLKVIATRSIEFGNHTRTGWNAFFMGTNFHPLKDKVTGRRSSGGKAIKIGEYCWFSTDSICLPGVQMPDRVICALGSVVTRNVDYESYCMYGGSPIHKIRENVYRDYDDDKDPEVG